MIDDVVHSVSHGAVIVAFVVSSPPPIWLLVTPLTKRFDHLQQLLLRFGSNTAAAVIQIGDPREEHEAGEGLGCDSADSQANRHINTHEKNKRYDGPSRDQQAPAAPNQSE